MNTRTCRSILSFDLLKFVLWNLSIPIYFWVWIYLLGTSLFFRRRNRYEIKRKSKVRINCKSFKKTGSQSWNYLVLIKQRWTSRKKVLDKCFMFMYLQKKLQVWAILSIIFTIFIRSLVRKSVINVYVSFLLFFRLETPSMMLLKFLYDVVFNFCLFFRSSIYFVYILCIFLKTSEMVFETDRGSL